MEKLDKNPLKILNVLLKWIYGKERIDEIEGDLLELYHLRKKQNGHFLATLHYIQDAIISLRNLRITHQYRKQPTNLFYHHWLITKRIISRNIFYTFLNVVGITLGMASFLVIHSYIAYESSFDNFHKKAHQIHRVDYELIYKDELLAHSATTPPTIAKFIKDEVPGITDYVRILKYPDLVIQLDNAIFREEHVLLVDPSFFNVFDFQVLEGNAETALAERGAMMISQEAKAKFFGDKEAIGKTVSIDGYQDYFITGVFQRPPSNSHLQFNFLLSFETAKWWSEGATETDWTSGDYFSYLLLDSLTDPQSVATTLHDINLLTPQGKIDEPKGVKRHYGLTALKDIHLNSTLEEEIDHSTKGNALYIRFFSIISYAILFIVWFNYINYATTRYFTRSKEIGLRKVIGASKRNILSQFLLESYAIQTIGIVIGASIAIIGMTYLAPSFGLGFRIKDLLNAPFLIQNVLFLLFGIISSSLLPAFYLSATNPLQGLKGSLQSGLKAQYLRKTMVGFQLATSVVMITCSLIVFLQLKHIRNQRLGFELEKTLVVKGPTTEDTNPKLFSEALIGNTRIQQMATTSHIPGTLTIETAPIRRNDLQEKQFLNVNHFSVGYQYLSSLKVKFLAGRDFDPSFQTDTSALILNTAALKTLGFAHPEEAINTTMTFGSGWVGRIIGVIEDYRQTSAKSEPMPLVFWLYPDEYVYYTVKFLSNEKETLEQARTVFQSLYPQDPFEFFFLEDYYNQQFARDKQFGNMFLLFTCIALVMTCLGFLSIVYWSLAAKKKKIGIRKILGATVSQIIRYSISEFLVILAIAYAVAIPIIHVVIASWLDSFALRISINPAIHLFSFLVFLSIITLSIGHRVFKSAAANPIDSLHEE